MSTIPNHPVQYCRNIHCRHNVFDELMDSVFRAGPVAARATIESWGDARLLKEYDHYAKGENCFTCFLAIVYAKYQENSNPVDTNGVFYFEVECNRSEIDDERSLARLMKQKTDPIEAYIYDIVGNERCRVRCAYKPKNGTRIRVQTLQRAFPEGSEINSKADISRGRLNLLLANEAAEKFGF